MILGQSTKLSAVLLLLGFVVATAPLSGAEGRRDAAAEKKRATLRTVTTVLTAPLLFATDTLGELPAASDAPPKRPPKDPRQMEQYQTYLRTLEKHLQARLAERSQARLGWKAISQEQLEEALKSLHMQLSDLFLKGGRLSGRRFDAPNPANVAKLAAALHVDAVLIGTVDEPRKGGGAYYFDPLAGIGYDSPRVNLRGSFDLLLADGVAVLKHPLEVVHPRTHINGKAFELADWMEAGDLLVEDLMDEISRYTPPAHTPVVVM